MTRIEPIVTSPGAHLTAPPKDEPGMLDDPQMGKRKRVSSWVRRHVPRRSKKAKKVELKHGCTVLHTSTNRMAASAKAEDSRVFFPSSEPLDRDEASSFHSCYEYERDCYHWVWYDTAYEVLRSYANSMFSKGAFTLLRVGLKDTLRSNASAESLSTPRINQTLQSMSRVQTDTGEEAFWASGMLSVQPHGVPMLLDLINLPSIFPDCQGRKFAPTVHEVTKLGWSDIEAAKYQFPSLLPPSDDPSSEFHSLTKSMCGHWITIMNRSSDIENQFKYLGITYVKRSVLARIAIPITIFNEDRQADHSFSNHHTWIHSPIGLRHLNWSLTGDLSIDNDPDCGLWEGLVRVVSLKLPSMNMTVRALQRVMRRPNQPEQGLTIETRCVLPDYLEGRILLFQIDTYPRAFTHHDFVTRALHTTRILRFEHPVDNVLELTSHTALTEAGSLKGCTRLTDDDGVNVVLQSQQIMDD